MSSLTTDELLLQAMVRASDACIGKRHAAHRHGGPSTRLHAIDSELADILDSIQLLCERTGLPLPDGVPPVSSARATGAAVAKRILERYVSLLRMRKSMWSAAARAGDVATALRMDLAFQADAEAIRKHCERAKLPLPSELLEET
jgi:hypothetical protein